MANRSTNDVHLHFSVTIDGDSIDRLAEALNSARLVEVPAQSAPVSTRDTDSQQTPNQPLLVTSKQVASLLGICERTLWGMQNEGRMPEPIRIGRSVKWRYDEIVAWVAAGCPLDGSWTWNPRHG